MTEPKRLAIVTTHPIQYNAPFFRALTKLGKTRLKVFYTWDKGSGIKHDPGFGQQIEWDIPLLDGYEYAFVKNTSKKPGSYHFRGIYNPTLINEINDYRPDFILVYGWNFWSNLKVLRYFKGKIPVWFRGDSHLLDEVPGLKTFLRRVFLKWVYKHVDRAFYVGSNNKAYFLAHGLKEEQLVFMPHVVDNDFFSRNPDSQERQALEWRRSLNIADEDFVVLFAGKFEPKKNPELLVHSIIAINEQFDSSPDPIIIKSSPFLTFPSPYRPASAHPRIHLILVGNGILEAQLSILSEGKPYIHFLPFQNQSKMPVVYRLGNVFCLPSKGPGETWGLGVNEALACGRKVIVSDKVGCAPDLINCKTGVIFSNKDCASLSNAIIAIYHAENKFLGKNLLPDNFTIFSNVIVLNQFFK